MTWSKSQERASNSKSVRGVVVTKSSSPRDKRDKRRCNTTVRISWMRYKQVSGQLGHNACNVLRARAMFRSKSISSNRLCFLQFPWSWCRTVAAGSNDLRPWLDSLRDLATSYIITYRKSRRQPAQSTRSLGNSSESAHFWENFSCRISW